MYTLLAHSTCYLNGAFMHHLMSSEFLYYLLSSELFWLLVVCHFVSLSYDVIAKKLFVEKIILH